MKRVRNIILISAISALISLPSLAAAEMKATFLYNLSNFSGTVPTTSARISIDAVHKEVYVISGDLVRVFNANGMEIYSFGEDLNAGVLYDAAVDEKGNVYVLSYSFERERSVITLCNYRGEPIREVTFTNMPPDLEGFRPSRMIYRNGTIYLVSESAMMVVVIDANGVFKESIDLFPLMDIKPEKKREGKVEEVKRGNHTIAGFYLDHEGNMLFTEPNVAKVFVVSPDRKVDSFGKRGGAPGRLAVPRGMTRDKSGNYLVSDILKCVVMVYNKEFEFKLEFGYRGFGRGNLIGPTDMLVDEDSKLYVTQLMERGVSVFKLEGN